MSKIEWTNVTWNPVTGCNKVSQGCKNCYAEIMHRRLRGMFPDKYKSPFLSGVDLHYDELLKPLDWKTDRMVFVNSMSDLFHEDVPFDFIDLVYQTMAYCYSHTFQVLTKRAKRMAEYYVWKNAGNGVVFPEWPLKNVWIGVSCEDQAAADERIPFLAELPSAVRFLSCEPLLGPIDLTKVNPAPGRDNHDDYLRGIYYPIGRKSPTAGIRHGKTIQWVITGGESGHRARPVHPDWVRSLRDQCAAAGVPFFFKQWGEFLPFEPTAQPPFWRNVASGHEYDSHGMDFYDAETGEPGKWHGHRWFDPMDAITLSLETKSGDCNFLKVGKHNSGNRLDGKEYLNFPTLNYDGSKAYVGDQGPTMGTSY